MNWIIQTIFSLSISCNIYFFIFLRISKTAWLKEEEHADVGHVYTRTHQLTGLNMETSEELQVSNYGIGGHYEPHFDFARREEKNAFASLGTGKLLF